MYVEESMNSQIQITSLLKWTWKINCTFCFAEELDSAAIDGWDNNSRIFLEHPYCVCIWHALHTSLGSESSHGRGWGSFKVRTTPMVYCKMILSMIGFQSFLGQYLMLIPPTKPLSPSPLARIQVKGTLAGCFSLNNWWAKNCRICMDFMCEMSMRYWTNKFWKPIIERIILQWTIGVILTFKLLQWTMYVEQSLNSQIQIYFSFQMDMEDRMQVWFCWRAREFKDCGYKYMNNVC